MKKEPGHKDNLIEDAQQALRLLISYKGCACNRHDNRNCYYHRVLKRLNDKIAIN